MGIDRILFLFLISYFWQKF